MKHFVEQLEASNTEGRFWPRNRGTYRASLLLFGLAFVFGDHDPPTARLTGDVYVTANASSCLAVSGHQVADAYIKEACIAVATSIVHSYGTVAEHSILAA